MLSIGVDIVDIKRIKRILKRDDGTFLARVFTKKEISNSSRFLNKNTYFAKLFSFKESFAKAKGTGFVNSRKPTDIEIDYALCVGSISRRDLKVYLNNKKVNSVQDVRFFNLNGDVVCQVILDN